MKINNGLQLSHEKITLSMCAKIFHILLCTAIYLKLCYGCIKSGTKDEMSVITRFVTMKAATKNNESNLVTGK